MGKKVRVALPNSDKPEIEIRKTKIGFRYSTCEFISAGKPFNGFQLSNQSILYSLILSPFLHKLYD